MYSSIVIAVLGWGIWSENLFRIILVLVLFVFSDLKSRVEERWLNEIYPEFPEYCKIVKKKFFPEIY
jgi:protein-S-isoprenylcysteine O-methyltransferase Ste14